MLQGFFISDIRDRRNCEFASILLLTFVGLSGNKRKKHKDILSIKERKLGSISFRILTVVKISRIYT